MGWTRQFHTISSHCAPPPSSLPLPPPVRYRCTLGKNGMKSTRRGHSLVRSLVRSHCSLICLLRTARFAPALRCARSLARLLTCWFACLLTRSRVLGRVFFSMKWTRRFHAILSLCAPLASPPPLLPPDHHPCTLGRNGLKLMRRVLGLSARLLALLNHLIAPHCTRCSRTLLSSYVCSFAHSLPMFMNWMRRFHSLSTHSALLPL